MLVTLFFFCLYSFALSIAVLRAGGNSLFPGLGFFLYDLAGSTGGGGVSGGFGELREEKSLNGFERWGFEEGNRLREESHEG